MSALWDWGQAAGAARGLCYCGVREDYQLSGFLCRPPALPLGLCTVPAAWIWTADSCGWKRKKSSVRLGPSRTRPPTAAQERPALGPSRVSRVLAFYPWSLINKCHWKGHSSLHLCKFKLTFHGSRESLVLVFVKYWLKWDNIRIIIIKKNAAPEVFISELQQESLEKQNLSIQIPSILW